MRIFHGLTFRLVVGFLLLFFLTAGLTFEYTYQSSKEALFSTLQQQLKDIASTTASQLNGDVVASLKPGDEISPQFLAVRDELLTIRKNSPDIHYSYIMRPHGDKLEFAVDDTYGKEPGAASIGDVYQGSQGPAQEKLDTEEILKGMQGPAVASKIFTDQWGAFLSGYAPVISSSGKAVAVLGVDMDASQVLNREDFIGKQIYAILGVILLASLFLIIYFASLFSRDVRKLTKALQEINQRQERITTTPTHRKDELGELAKTVQDVEANIWAALGKNHSEGPHF